MLSTFQAWVRYRTTFSICRITWTSKQPFITSSNGLPRRRARAVAFRTDITGPHLHRRRPSLDTERLSRDILRANDGGARLGLLHIGRSAPSILHPTTSLGVSTLASWGYTNGGSEARCLRAEPMARHRWCPRFHPPHQRSSY